jgi:hypothetical protein
MGSVFRFWVPPGAAFDAMEVWRLAKEKNGTAPADPKAMRDWT